MSSVHSEELVLLSYLDGELDAARAAAVREHLDDCEECRAYIAEAATSLGLFQEANRASLPTPPKPWIDLRPRLNELDAERRQLRRSRPSFQPLWWAAAAAAIAFLMIAVRLGTTETVNAAELLAKASAQEVAPARIQVRTRKGTFVRTAQDSGDSEIAAMFRKSNFDWEQPLRAGAFAQWRNNLTEKRDEVRVLRDPPARIGRFYKITTSTPEGGLSEVSVTIRASDLQAVEERFQFRNDEWVEISEAPGAPAQEPVRPAVPRPSVASTPATSPSVEDEIRAWEALHRIGADLGEPVEVRRGEDTVEVTVLGASASREKQIQAALTGLANVTLKFEQPQAVRSAASDSVEPSVEPPSGPLHSRLLRLMESATQVEAFTNSALEKSEVILARAHALRVLAERFPGSNEAVRSMALTHHRSIRDSVAQLKETLRPLTGPIAAQSIAVSVDVRSMLGAAQRIDTLLNLALASSNQKEDPDDVINRLRRAVGELDGASAGYRP